MVATIWMVALPTTASDYSRLIEQYEIRLYGQTSSEQSLLRRVDAIEKTLWGIDKDWALPKAIRQIEGVLGKGDSESGEPRTYSDNDAGIGKTHPLRNDLEDETNGHAKSTNRRPVALPIDKNVSVDDIEDMLEEGLAADQSGNKTEAERLFRKVLEHDPFHTDAHFSLAVLLSERSELSDAVFHLKEVLKVAPSDPDALELLARLKASPSSRSPKAQKDQSGWIEDPSVESLEGGHQTDSSAVADSSKSKRKESKSSDSELVAKAASDYKGGNYHSAIKSLLKYMRNHPDDAKAQYALARAYEANGDVNTASYFANKAAAQNPYNPQMARAKSELEATRRRSGLPTYVDLKDPPAEITPMSPEPGERVYNLAQSGMGRLVRYTLGGAALGAGMGSFSNQGMGRSALQGGMFGLALGLLGW